jgi:ERCC4-type nuclease
MRYTYRGMDKPRPGATGTGAVLGKPELGDFLCIRIDTREQAPLRFDSEYVKAGAGTVPVFDYALDGDQNLFSIERKSLADFVQAVVIGKSWKRELAKIEKAAARLMPVVYVCEFLFDDIARFEYARFVSGNVTPQFVYRRVAEMIFKLNVHVLFAGSREAAACAICLLLKRRKEQLRGA